MDVREGLVPRPEVGTPERTRFMYRGPASLNPSGSVAPPQTPEMMNDGGAMPTIEELHQRRRELEDEIAEAQRRLPAHSVKPPVMKLLLDLEDEYDEVLKAIEALKGNSSL